MPVFIYICTYCVTLWNKMSLTCWLYTLNSPVEGSPASRKRQFGFTSLPNDNGGKKLFPIICSKHLSLRAYMLTHWKTTLKYMHGLDLMILLKNKKFYKFWQMSHLMFLVPMVIAVMLFCLIFTVSKALK